MARAARKPSPVRRLLGDRARDALFDLSDEAPRLVEIDTARIHPHPDQPRRQIDEGSIDELAQSIEQHGLLQPIVVKSEGDDYVLVAGQRRLLAHRRLGRERIIAIITAGRPDELALIENLQREALAPLDEAEALAALKERYGYTQEQLAQVLAKAKSTISELLSLNELSAAIKDAVRESGKPISKSVLIEVARRGGEGEQLAFWRNLHRLERPTVRRARESRAPSSRPNQRVDMLLRSARQLLKGLDGLTTAEMRRDAALKRTLLELQHRLEAMFPATQPRSET
jgi:ParB family transcriptional regulator, chromosome partitioning protein